MGTARRRNARRPCGRARQTVSDDSPGVVNRTMSEHANIEGACHCGNLSFNLAWPTSQREIPARACGCSFCRKHASSWTSHCDAVLRIMIVDPALASRYRFGTSTADFVVCGRCGVAPFILSEIDAVTYAVVNVNTFSDLGGFSLAHASASFDGEELTNRLERRRRNWIPDVRVGTT